MPPNDDARDALYRTAPGLRFQIQLLDLDPGPATLVLQSRSTPHSPWKVLLTETVDPGYGTHDLEENARIYYSYITTRLVRYWTLALFDEELTAKDLEEMAQRGDPLRSRVEPF
jgi:hypothetical protein